MEISEQEKITAALNEKYEDQILRIETLYDFLTITVKSEKIIEVIQHLYKHPHTKFQFLTTMCAVHYPDLNQIAVVYQLHNLVSNNRLRLKIYLPAENPVTPTLTTVFPAANWMERETYDFYGVTFTGHPQLKRILNVEDMIIFPLRKEYPLEDQTREDKNDTMFGR
ncbi:NADH-quinone oxidoreductase subunit C [Pseudochryseolinea flava]|uniref:NADH-quinone oxidoreductase subunit C n=1 Tax=Pseudochryseolinea flava TaxID=2059302 RepID=A0A364XZ13_9BACT|nr:NADH-quinone oxidoreductase subunit C [Pseudochryseolinea flava]RAV99049.1 NADH-quinone oxidoreductase subunit C [Pseudochryseolinea flava]